jgi:transcriptional regulator with XRE-family HTH domain
MLAILPEQCRAARALLDWSQQDLAARAKVARKTVADFELKQVRPYARTLRDVVEAFESAGIAFLAAEENVSGPGVRLKLTAPPGEVLPSQGGLA